MKARGAMKMNNYVKAQTVKVQMSIPDALNLLNKYKVNPLDPGKDFRSMKAKISRGEVEANDGLSIGRLATWKEAIAAQETISMALKEGKITPAEVEEYLKGNKHQVLTEVFKRRLLSDGIGLAQLDQVMEIYSNSLTEPAKNGTMGEKTIPLTEAAMG